MDNSARLLHQREAARQASERTSQAEYTPCLQQRDVEWQRSGKVGQRQGENVGVPREREPDKFHLEDDRLISSSA